MLVMPDFSDLGDPLHTGGWRGDEEEAQTVREHRKFHNKGVRHLHAVKPCKNHLLWMFACEGCTKLVFHEDGGAIV